MIFSVIVDSLHAGIFILGKPFRPDQEVCAVQSSRGIGYGFNIFLGFTV